MRLEQVVAGREYSSTYECLPAETVVELHDDGHRVDLRRADIHVSRIRPVRVGPHEQTVVPRSQRVEGKATAAVRNRGYMRRVWVITGDDGENRIMRQRSTSVRERSDDAAETRSRSGSQRKSDHWPFAADARRTRANYVD